MKKEEVVVVVGGLVAELIVMGTLVPADTSAAVMVIEIEVELRREQLELIVHEQVVVPLVKVT